MSADVFAEDGYYAVIPEWVLDADISAQAVRLYAVLRRYADQRSMLAHPSRRTLATRMHVASTRTVDAALAELQELGAVETFDRFRDDGSQTSSGYRIKAKNAHPRAADCEGGGGADCTPPMQPAAHHEPQPENHSQLNHNPRKRGTRLSPIWTPTEDDVVMAARFGLVGAALDREIDTFRDYWVAQPGQKGIKLDWAATWRNWVRRGRTERPTTAGVNGTKLPAAWS